MTPRLPACVAATHRRPLDLVIREALLAALFGLLASWGLAELVLRFQGL
ncbi:hypothetical protein [Roseomonas sp. BN140053]